MTDELWHHVRKHPRDFDARRVLADALLARGDEQGELLRLCLLPEGERAQAKGEVARLLAAHAERWYPRPPWYTPRDSWCHPDSLLRSGGVPDSGSTPPTPADLAWWLERYPLRELWTSNHPKADATLRVLVDGGHFERLEVLHLDAQFGPGVLPSLLPHVGPGLERLWLTLAGVAPEVVEGLAVGRWLHGVRALWVSLKDPLHLVGLWPRLPALGSLRVQSYDLMARPVPALAPKALRELSVSVDRSEGGSARRLAGRLLDAVEPASLEAVSLTGCELETSDLQPFTKRASSAGLSRLRKLGLSTNLLDLVPELLALELPRLTELDLRHNELGLTNLERVLQQRGLASVKRLGLVGNQVFTSHEPVYDSGIEVGSRANEASPDQLRAMLEVPASIEVF